MNVMLTGGRGFIGTFLTDLFVARGDEVTIVSRTPDAEIPARQGVRVEGWLPDVRQFDAIVHLAGEPIFGKRWSAEQKENLRTSRVSSTRKIAQSIAELPAADRPRVFVSGSAIGYYGSRGDEVLDERAAQGDDFLAKLCTEWEAASEPAAEAGVRTVNLRTGIVLGKDGGALSRMLLPFKLGLGGPLGSGKQWWSWVHLKDLCRLCLHAIDSESLSGPVNGTAPHPMRNLDFSRTLGRVLGRPAFLPAPAIALRVAIGEAVAVLTASQRCNAAKSTGSGFEFEFPELEGAFEQLLPR